MNTEKIKEILSQMSELEALHVEGDGHHFQIQIVSKAFEGKRTLQRHQYVYQFLKDYIADGSLHAVEIKAYTPKEWDKNE
jgi:acid stress-induced BolA-like protein IbaG/YrbA